MADGLQLGQWERIDFVHRLEVSAAEKALLIAVAKHQSRWHGECFASQVTLARETGFKRKTIQRAITRLVAAGILIADRRKGRPPVLTPDWDLVAGMVEVAYSPKSQATYSPKSHVPAPTAPDVGHALAHLGHSDAKLGTLHTPTCSRMSHKGSEGFTSKGVCDGEGRPLQDSPSQLPQASAEPPPAAPDGPTANSGSRGVAPVEDQETAEARREFFRIAQALRSQQDEISQLRRCLKQPTLRVREKRRIEARLAELEGSAA